MNSTLQTGDLATLSTPCLVLGVHAGRQLPAATATVDAASGGYLTRLLARGDLEGELEQTLLLHEPPGLACERLLLVGLGKSDTFSFAHSRKVIAAVMTVLAQHRITEATWTLHHYVPDHAQHDQALRDALLTIHDMNYRFERLKSEVNPNKNPPLKTVHFWCPAQSMKLFTERTLLQGHAIAEGVALAKDLANLPGNFCTPSYLAAQALALAEQSPKIAVRILEQAELETLGMGAFLSVARGSRQPPKLIVLEYRNAAPEIKPVVFVGKAITFDSGGISLKPGDAMDEMKFDMSGGAAVLGTLQACAHLQLPLNVVGIIPATENLPDGNASKPGDVVTSMSGLTIEILNTDAEGRLILCDALTYSERFEPEVVIDIATLTGACVIALGKHASGLLANDHQLAQSLLIAGEWIHDRAWQLPLWEEYQSQLDSRFADMANVGGRPGGTITAACFLARFTKKLRWAHLDIAGTAWLTGDKKGATGRPVPLLTAYLLQRCGFTSS